MKYDFRMMEHLLDKQFPNRWICRSGPTRWPARSPDLTKIFFFREDTLRESCMVKFQQQLSICERRLWLLSEALLQSCWVGLVGHSTDHFVFQRRRTTFWSLIYFSFLFCYFVILFVILWITIFLICVLFHYLIYCYLM